MSPWHSSVLVGPPPCPTFSHSRANLWSLEATIVLGLCILVWLLDSLVLAFQGGVGVFHILEPWEDPAYPGPLGWPMPSP